jgi:hypothetical protein
MTFRFSRFFFPMAAWPKDFRKGNCRPPKMMTFRFSRFFFPMAAWPKDFRKGNCEFEFGLRADFGDIL